MVGASKILTVSYGTFSCTLEGFDDSFDTMKAIAEYFRDLAADDRYFGAEPPTPDAEMLQRIAEREVRKRVEARVEDDGIVLRAESEAPSLPSAAPVTPAQAAAPAPAAPAAPRFDDSGSVAAKLARIRAVVDTARADTPVEDEDFGMNAPQSFVPPTDPGEQPMPAPVAEAELAPVADEAPEAEEIAETPEAVTEEVAEAEEAEPVEAEAEEDQAIEDTTSDAAVVEALAEFEMVDDDADIDASEEVEIAEAADEDSAEEMDFLEEEAILSAVAEEADFDEPEIAEIADEDDEDADDMVDLRAVLTDEAAPEEEFEDTADSLASSVLKLVSDDEVEEEDAQDAEALQVEATDEAEAEYYEDDLDTDLAFEDEDSLEEEVPVALSPLAEDDAEEIEAAAEEDTETADDGWGAVHLGISDDDMAAEADEDAAEEEEPVERTDSWRIDRRPKSDAAKRALERARARVMMVKRPDAEDDFEDEAVAPAELSMALGIDTAEPEQTEVEDLSDEDEADLLAELAEEEIAAEYEAPAAEVTPMPEAPENQRRDRMKSSNLEEEEVAVSRLLEETNSKLDGPEHRRRRSAIAHLKAAVAATVAERRLKPTSNRDAEAEAEKHAYRQDLAEVVRPTPGGSKDTGPTAEDNTDAPTASADAAAMPPLMLVSEQRVDQIKPAGDGGMVRPRRVTKGNLALKELPEDDAYGDTSNDDGGVEDFATFVEAANIDDTNDLMEAAAAYLALQEAAPFSRPDIMKLVTEYGDDADKLDREDGLRAFGTLLRLGKIEKVKRGQFTISQSSRFMR